MKRILALLLTFTMLPVFAACGQEEQDAQPKTTAATEISETIEQEHNESSPNHQYIGDYQNEPVYQKLMQIESCQNPDILCSLLAELYGEEFNYIKMTHKSTNNPDADEYSGYEEPYEDFVCSSFAIYNTTSSLCNVPTSSDTYLFFKPYHEAPSFMMDGEGTYIVDSYDIKSLDDGSYYHSISSWTISDLFMCLHGYIDADSETKSFCQDAVRYMDYYLELENLIVDGLGTNSGNISKTNSLNPSIDILSIDVTGPTMHELNVKYKINNISTERGVVYLTCSGHAYQDELHFNDNNFKNDFREDGYFDYDVYYGGEEPVTFTIFYGYGEFDAYEGWDSECMTSVSFLYAEEYDIINNYYISPNELHPLYFEGQYVGSYWY